MAWINFFRSSRSATPKTIEFDPDKGLTRKQWESLPQEARAVLPWNFYGDEDLGLRSTSGAAVSEDTALKIGVVYAAAALISDGIASLPPKAYVESEDGNRTTVPVPQWIRKPDPEIRRFDIFSQLLMSVLLWGNAFAQFIRRPSDGVIIGLMPLDPADVTVEWDSNKPGYRRYRINNTGPWLTSADIFHLQGPTKPGDHSGISVIRAAREALGLGLTLEEYGARYFGQGSQAKIVIELPNTVDEQKAKDIVRTFERFHRGKGNWHRPAIVSGGAKLHQISIAPEDAQFLQSREHQAIDIARWFRVPPHRVGIISASTSWGSGLAEENAAMLQHTFRPWIMRLQEALTAYSPFGQGLGTMIELDTSALLEGTFKEKADVWTGLYEKQIVTKNEARLKLGLQKVKDGDQFFDPSSGQMPPNDANSPGIGGRTQEQDRLRKQDQASRSLMDSFDQELLDVLGEDDFEYRAGNPNHDKLGRFSSSKTPSAAKISQGTLEGKISTGSTASNFAPGSPGAKALDKLDKDWGISHEDLKEELHSKITPEGLAQDGKWFSQEAHTFNADLAQRSGLSLEQVTAITAITSARNPWVKNKEIAERIALKHKDYEGMDSMTAAKKMGGYLSANMAPAIEVARGTRSPDDITGIKRRSFFNNMLHPHQTDDVTVDTWMQRTAMNAVSRKRERARVSLRKKMGRDPTEEELRAAGAPKAMSLDDSLKYLNAAKGSTKAGAGYIRIADASRDVAEELGVSGDEIQSTYWVAASGHREGLWGGN